MEKVEQRARFESLVAFFFSLLVALTALESLQNRKLMPKFVLKEMESLYIEEAKGAINLLMANLETVPVSKGTMDSKYGLQKLKRYNHRYVQSPCF